MNHYSSCLDSSFLPRGLALYRSLVRHAQPFRWWVLCLDDAVYDAFRSLDLDGVVPVAEADVMDADLARAKTERSRREYYFSCKPWIDLFVFASEPAAQRVTYLDGDLYFFSDASALDDLISDAAVALSPHRSNRAGWESMFGLYNSGWSSFANDDEGRAALRWWRDRCAEAVPDYPVDGLFADQKYLEWMPSRFERVVVVEHKGVNLAPWNAGASAPIERVDGRVVAGGDPLVFFHFHGLSRLAPGLYDPGWAPRGALRMLRAEVYKPYLKELTEVEHLAERALRKPTSRPAPWGATKPRPWWWRTGRSLARLSRGAATGRFMVAPRT